MTGDGLTERLRETLAVFDPTGAPLTTTEVAEQVDLGRRSTYERLERLVDCDRLATKKVGASARVWWRPATPAAETEAPDWSTAAESLVGDVLDGAEVGVFVLDSNFDVAWINGTTERYFGLDREHVLGRDKRRLIDETIASVIDDAETFVDRVLATYEANTYTEEFECHVTAGDDREERWLEHRSEPIESGAFAGGRVELYYDVTARRRSERRLQRERNLVERVLNTVPVRIAIFDADGSLERLNSQARRELDVAEGGSPFLHEELDLYEPDGTPLAPGDDPAAVAAETGETVTDRLVQRRTPDGDRQWVSLTATPLFDDAGDLERVVVAGTDVTELKRTQRQLERQRDDLEHELGSVFERVDDAFHAIDDDWQFTFVNERAAELLDRTPGELVGQNVWEAFPDAAGTRFQQEYERAMATGESTTFVEYSDPFDTWFEVSVYPSDTGLSVYFRDVTEREERERELERYADLVDAVGEPVYELDAEGRFTFVNDAFVEQLGATAEEVLGEHVSIGMDEDAIDRVESMMRELVAEDPEGTATAEYEVETAHGERISVENRLTVLTDADGRFRGSAGILRDVTEREERERELERFERAVEASGHAIYMTDPEGVITYVNPAFEEMTGYDASEAVGETPAILRSGEHDEAYYRTLWETVSNDEVWEEEIVDQRADGTNYHALQTIAPVTREDGTIDRYVAVQADLTDRKERERELVRQREQLEALNNINEVVRGITDAVVEQSTREEIEAAVCERLADTESYQFAWIGEVDAASRTVTLRSEAGVDGYLDDVTISVDPDDERSRGPTGRAFRTGEMQSTHDALTDPAYEPWRERAVRLGYRSSAAIPIVHEDTTYGVLNVFADRPDAFEGREGDVISQLGEVVGHAIAATERKRTLLSDEVVQLDLRVDDVFGALGVGGRASGTVVMDDYVPIGDGEYLVYGRVSEDGTDTLEAVVDAVPSWKSVSLDDGGSETRFELHLSEPPALSTAASVGGSVESAVIEDGDFRIRMHVAPSVDVRRVLDGVEDGYPSVTLLRRRQISRPEETGHASVGSSVDLTDRQSAVLETAYHAGFFEWPRRVSGKDLADSLDVAAPTFHQHLRKAERKVFEQYFASTSSLAVPVED